MQALDGAIKEQDIGQLFGEEFPATEEQHPGDHADDGADDKGADHGWTALASHDISCSLPAWPWAPGLTLRWCPPRRAGGRPESSTRARCPGGSWDSPPPAWSSSRRRGRRCCRQW